MLGGTVEQLPAGDFGSPLRWFETVAEYLDVCALRAYEQEDGAHRPGTPRNIRAIALIEVGDFYLGGRDLECQQWLQEVLQKRFKFGKWEHSSADFIGRTVTKTDKGEIHFHQDKYIVEKIHPIDLSRGRRGTKDAALTEEEFSSFRSMLYRVSWLAHQTRPEVCGAVSILALHMRQATVQDLIYLNKVVRTAAVAGEESISPGASPRKVKESPATYPTSW